MSQSEFEKVKIAVMHGYGQMLIAEYLPGKGVFDLRNAADRMFGATAGGVMSSIREDHTSQIDRRVHLDRLIGACDDAQKLYDVLTLIASVFDVDVSEAHGVLRHQMHPNNIDSIIDRIAGIRAELADVTERLNAVTNQLSATRSDLDLVRQQLSIKH
jgi:hypothetical protein